MQQATNTKSFKYDSNSIQKFVDEYKSVENTVKQTEKSHNKLNVAINTYKEKVKQAKNNINGINKSLKEMPKNTINITNNIKKMSSGVKSGLGNILKYAGALFGLRSIYMTLRQTASAWLSSQNAQAQQLSANIEYMKYAMGSVFAPIIEYITNLVYKLMKAIQSLVYAFSGVNIFAKATASSMKSTAGSAKQASKSLAGVHNEINNISENNGDSGSGGTSPNMDLSKIDGAMNNWATKWRKRLLNFFDPIKKAWDKQGQKTLEKAKKTFFSLKDTVFSIGDSLNTVWQNGTGQETFELIFNIFQNIFDTITNISDAWRNAWNDNNRGTQLIQTIWNALNKLLDIINKISKKIEEITSSPIVQEYFKNAIEMVTRVWDILGGLLDYLTGVFTGDWEKAFNGLKTIVLNIFGLIGNILNEKLLSFKLIVSNSLDTIKNIWSNGWTGIKQKASEIWDALLNKIDSVFPGMRNIIETNIKNVKTNISNILTSIKNKWNEIWNGVKTTTSNIWNGIYNAIKKPINWILSGIEKMANGVVQGMNKVITSLNRVKFTMPDWLGGGSFGINISTLNTISLPRLAKGNVAYSPMVAQFGEYSGASYNPEITTPQNIMRETFEDVLSDYQFSNNSQSIELSVFVGNERLGKILLNDLRNMRRQTGQGIEALVGG